MGERLWRRRRVTERGCVVAGLPVILNADAWPEALAAQLIDTEEPHVEEDRYGRDDAGEEGCSAGDADRQEADPDETAEREPPDE
jgi:hypothetical protein